MFILKNVTKTFGTRKIFENLSFEFSSRKMIGIYGPSGCGKSSLLNILSLLDKDYQGEVLFDRQNLRLLNSKEAALFRFNQIGYVFQDFNLLNKETVEMNLLVKIGNNKNAVNTIKSALSQTGMLKYLKQEVKNLSGGEKQRVAISRALLGNPQVLLCDEPTGSLDQEQSLQVMAILRKIAQEKTVIIVSHDEELLGLYCDELIDFENKRSYQATAESLHSFQKKRKMRSNNLNLSFLIKHALHYLLYKIGRTLFSVSISMIGLVILGVSFLLTTAVSTSIKNDLSKVLSENALFVSSTLNSDVEGDNLSISEDLGETIHQSFVEDVTHVGFVYFADYESMFPTNTIELLLPGISYKLPLGIRHLAETSLLEQEEVYPYSYNYLRDDQIIVGLTRRDIIQICHRLELDSTSNQELSYYLSEHPLYINLSLANPEWEYADGLVFEIKGFVEEKERNYFYHTNSSFNQIVIEQMLEMKISSNLNRQEIYPWTIKRAVYLKVKDQVKFIEKFITSNKMLGLGINPITSSSHPVICRYQEPCLSNIVYPFTVSNKGLTYPLLYQMLKDPLVKSFYPSHSFYFASKEMMVRGFSMPSYFIKAKDVAEKVVDQLSQSDENPFTNTIDLTKDDIYALGVKEFQKTNFMDYKTIGNNKLLYGRTPRNPLEIMMSFKTYQDIFQNNEFTPQTLHFITLKNYSQEGEYYHSFYEELEFTVTGIIKADKEEQKAFYQDPSFLYSLFINYLECDSRFLNLEGALLQLESSNKAAIEAFQSRYKEFEFFDPWKQFNQTIFETISFFEKGLLLFSLFVSIPATMVMGLTIYQFIVDNKKELATLYAIGISDYSLRVQFIILSLLLGFLSFLFSAFSLLLINLMMPLIMNLSVLSFSLKPFVITFVVSLLLSFISGFFATSSIKKFDSISILRAY